MFPILFGGLPQTIASGPTPPVGAAFATVAHPTLCRSDAANTIPCGDGDAIRWWQDLVTGVWYEQATSGNRLILRDAGGGKWYAESAAGCHHLFGSAGITGDTPAYLAVGLRTSTVVLSVPIVFGSSGARYQLDGIGSTIGFGNSTTNVSTSTPSVVGTDWRRVLYTAGNLTDWVAYQNGIALTPDGSSGYNPTGDGPVGVGGVPGGGVSVVGRIYAASIALSLASVASLDSWLLRYMP